MPMQKLTSLDGTQDSRVYPSVYLAKLIMKKRKNLSASLEAESLQD